MELSGRASLRGQRQTAERQQNRPGTAEEQQRTRDNEADLQQNRNTQVNQVNVERNTQVNYHASYNYYGGGGWGYPPGSSWGGYYAGIAVAGLAGIAVGAAIASIPRESQTIVVEGSTNNYYYSNGVYYAAQGSQYVVVPPPRGAIVATTAPLLRYGHGADG